ncbi:MAG TPA: hypothetical protein VFA56_12160 [Gaiellaceae bacterium]|nr:hypothetical protein [Gaiellaceae bacterium]
MVSIAAVPAAAGVISTVTVLNRLRVVALDDLAATPRAIQAGHVWLLATSAFVADRPAVPSIVGFLVVGLAALAVAGGRVLWASAIVGHVFATVVVYALLDAASYSVGRADYGTSAVIAAWIGVVAYHVHRRGRGAAALALCVVAALVGWLFRPDLDILDTEHAVALVFGAATAATLPRVTLPRPQRLVPPLQAWLLLRVRSARRGG